MRNYLVPALLLLVTTPLLASEFDPFYESAFDVPQRIEDWQIDSGVWQIANSRFESSAGGAADRVILQNYHPQIPLPGMTASFDLDVYVLMRSSAAATSTGIVYDFNDPTDFFYEVTLSPTGVAQLRFVSGNSVTVVASGTFAAPGANAWLHLNVVRRNLQTTVKVDGVPVIVNVPQAKSVGDKIGLVTHGTDALFDNFNVRASTRTSPYIEDFNDDLADGFIPTDTSWFAASGVYATTAVRETTMSLSPLNEIADFGESPFPLPYTFKVRMLNPYGGSGNLVGVVIRTDARNYDEIVFSPKGEAQMNRVTNGVRSRLATATYAGGGPNKWFDVEVTSFADFAGGGRVKVNGVLVFDKLSNDDLRSQQIGLITHWAPAKFDDVRMTLDIFTPVVETFNNNRQPPWLGANESWHFENGRVHSTGISAAQLAIVDRRYQITNIDYRVRMINHFGNTGNLVGLMYGAHELGDWYEVTFSPTGVARLTRVREGVTKVIATAPYSGGGPNVWFNVQLIQRDLHTTVRVNGVTVFNNVSQPDLGDHQLGLVTHWADAEFDDLSIQDIP